MTDIEQKALALIKPGAICEVNLENVSILATALCRAIEQHEAFRQEVSDAVEYLKALYPTMPTSYDRFIIAKPVDPLVDAVGECDDGTWETKAEYAQRLRAAIEKRGGKIVWGEG